MSANQSSVANRRIDLLRDPRDMQKQSPDQVNGISNCKRSIVKS
jgi:hypothetical protein